MVVMLGVIVPVISLAALCVAVSMGWIFVAIGRLKRPPRWIGGTIVALGVAMMELMALIVICGKSGGLSGGF